MLIWPDPVGKAMKITEAAEELHILPKTAYNMLTKLKKSCPVAYAKFQKDRQEQSKRGQWWHYRNSMWGDAFPLGNERNIRLENI